MKPDLVRRIFLRLAFVSAFAFAGYLVSPGQTSDFVDSYDQGDSRPRTLRPVIPGRFVFWKSDEYDAPARTDESSQTLSRRNPLGFLLKSPITLVSLDSIPRFGPGRFSINGSPPDTNMFYTAAASFNLGVAPDDSTLVRDAGRLPALTASGGMNSLAPLSATGTMQLDFASDDQISAGSTLTFTPKTIDRGLGGSFYEFFGNDLLNARDPYANAYGLQKGAYRSNLFGASVGGSFFSRNLWFRSGYEGLRLRQPAFAVSEVPTNSARTTANGQTSPWLRAFPRANRGDTADGFGLFTATFSNPADHDIFEASVGSQIKGVGTSYFFRVADSSSSVRGDSGLSASTLRQVQTRTESHGLRLISKAGIFGLSGGFGLSRSSISQAFLTDDFGGGSALSDAPEGFFRSDTGGFNGAVVAGPRIETTIRRIHGFGQTTVRFSRNELIFRADFFRLDVAPGLSLRETRIDFTSADAAATGIASRITAFQRRPSRAVESSAGMISAIGKSYLFNRVSLRYGFIWYLDFPSARASDDVELRGGVTKMPDSTGNFAPRISASWSFGDNSIKGGAGLYFDTRGSQAAEADANSFPLLAGAFSLDSAAGTVPSTPIRAVALFDAKLVSPRVWQVHGEYSRLFPFRAGIITASYIETFGRHLHRTRTIVDQNAAFNLIRLTDSDGTSRFRALRISWMNSTSRASSIGISYSLAKSSDNSPSDTLREWTDGSFFASRAASDFDIRQSFIASFTRELPVFFDGGVLEKITQDWNFSIISVARSGSPINVGTIRRTGFGNQFAAADLVFASGILRNSGDQLLNPGAFRAASAGTAGSAGRNSIRGLAFFQTDASIKKRFRTGSNQGFEISVTAANVFNNVNRSDVSGILGTEPAGGGFQPNRFFGRAIGIVGGNGFSAFNYSGGPRSLTLGLRFLF